MRSIDETVDSGGRRVEARTRVDDDDDDEEDDDVVA